jgi:hypothetical protein
LLLRVGTLVEQEAVEAVMVVTVTASVATAEEEGAVVRSPEVHRRYLVTAEI